MRHNENENRHRHHREMHHHRERHHPPHHEEHFQDFRSRWGEPEPLIHLNHQGRHSHEMRHPEDIRHPQDMSRPQDMRHWRDENHPENYGRHPEEDWHDPRHNAYEQHREPVWRQRDVYFDQSNQRAEDRWNEGDSQMMPHPKNRNEHGRRPHPRDTRWNEYDENEY
ncbi:hypothetical protein [Pontibacter sp. H249]|uniref:hypothetical protein n=1 Tax=Pontibacter sp. H249 TaxID=3133420 RepID=UPI0030BEC466